MRRIAFSVWPGAEGNVPRKDLETVRAMTCEVLKEKFDEIIVVSDFAPFDEISTMMFKKFKSPYIVKDYINWSDYIRIIKMKEFLEGDYDEVMYFDYDLLVFEVPKTYGCVMEGHFESTDGNINNCYKFWMRGVNSAYYLNKSHLPILNEHLTLIQDYIKSQDGKPKFCYPMNYLAPIEEKIGYIEGYYHLSSFDNVQFCTMEKCLAFVELMVDFTKNENWRTVNTMNMSGSTKVSQEENIAVCRQLRENAINRSMHFDINKLKDIVRNTTKPIRVNYGSGEMRRKIQQYFVDDSAKLF